MPAAVEVDQQNRGVTVNGDVHLVAEIKRLAVLAKQEGTTIHDVLSLALPDKTGNDKDHNQTRNIGDDINNYPLGKPYSVALRDVPITVERLPYYPKDGDKLIDAGVARVNIAPSTEAPEGTTQDDWAKTHQNKTIMQQHVEYFDPDNDGIIWPTDTYKSFAAWGWAFPLCLFGMLIIHGGLSYPSSPSWLPDPFFRIHVANIHKAKHGSDSGSYDSEGRFRAQNFEDVFAKYDKGNKGGLSIRDMGRLIKGQRVAMDPFGWTAAFLEWFAIYLLIWPEDGVVRKDDIRRVFDGSIFQYKADEYAEKQRKKGKKA